MPGPTLKKALCHTRPDGGTEEKYRLRIDPVVHPDSSEGIGLIYTITKRDFGQRQSDLSLFFKKGTFLIFLFLFMRIVTGLC